jgi:tetrahydromethanopterin S-methyltransferase subunit G
VGFFWGFSITRDIGVVSGLIVGGIAGVVTVLAGK